MKSRLLGLCATFVCALFPLVPAHAATFTVTSTADTDGSSCGTNCTLRQAINAANMATGDDNISFDQSVFSTPQTIFLTLGQLAVSSSISITGPAQQNARLTVSGNNRSRVFLLDYRDFGSGNFNSFGNNLTLSNVSIVGGNNNDIGSGIYSGGTLLLNNCTLSYNSAVTQGGGLFNIGPATLNGCTFTGNSAGGSGAGYFNSGGVVTLNNCTFAANDTRGSGGALGANYGTTNINNCTFSGNSASKGTGLFGANGQVNVANSILNDSVENQNSINSKGFNLLKTNSGFPGNGTTDKISNDLKLDPHGLQNNGGVTQTIALLASSPAVDAGNSDLTTDQRGFKRPIELPDLANADGGNGSDIGAFEVQDLAQSGADFVVNQTEDHDDSVCGKTDCTLREAINAANANANTSAITFDANVFGSSKQTITVTSALSVSSSVSISANTPGVTISGGGTTIILYVNGPSVSLSKLTFIQGLRGNFSVQQYGGDLSVEGCTFAQSQAGLIHFESASGSLQVRNSSFSNGDFGLYCRGNQILVQGCTFTGCQELGLGSISDNAGTLTVQNCTFARNYHGIVLNPGTALSVQGCTIVENKGDGIVFSPSSHIDISNSIIVGNASDLSGTPTSNSFNIIGGTVADAGLQVSDGKAVLADNGGQTQTIALLPGSAALDMGDPAITTGTDQRGFARVRNGRADIGAFETQDESPTAEPDAYNTTEDTLLTISAAKGVLLNDSDSNAGDAFSVSVKTNPTNGTLRLQSDGAFTYQPSADFNGNDSFTYTLSDGFYSTTSTVSISVSEVNDAPTLDKPTDVQVNGNAGTQRVTLTGITSGPTNESGQRLSITATSDNTALIANPTVGYTSPNTSGTLSFRSIPNGSGTATISVSVRDKGTTGGVADPKTTTQTFVITVRPINAAPVVTSVTITPRSPITSSILTANLVATDAENDSLTFSYVWKKNGAVIPNETGKTLDLGKPGNGDEGDRITVSVVANDGTSNSRSLTSAAVTVYNFAPTVVSVSPQDATDKVGDKRTFVLSATDRNGAGDIIEVSLLINEGLDLNSGALLRFDVPSGTLFLKSGDSFLSGIKIGTAARAGDVLDNGAVHIVGSEVSIANSTDGQSLSLSIPATIRNGLVGKNILFARAQDAQGLASSAREGGFVRSGTYTVQSQFAGTTNSIPMLSGMSPNAANTTIPASGTATSQTFVFYTKDEDGIGDLDSLSFLAGRTRTGAGTANFVFLPRTRRLYLRSDDGRNLLGGILIGRSGVLENSQVRLDVSKAQLLIYPDGKSLGLRLPIQAKSGLIGQNKVWLRVQDRSGALAAGGDALGYVPSGTWNITTLAKAAMPSDPSGGNS